MKNSLLVLPFLLLFIVLSGCTNYGTKKTFDGTDVYRTAQITEQEADNVGKYLVDEKFADGREKTVQLTKAGEVYQFRFVVKEGTDKDTTYAKSAKLMATMLSAQVFNGAPLEVHLCDDQLKTLKVFVADDFGKQKIFNGVQMFHTRDINVAQVDSLGNYLVSSKFADGKSKSVLITKSGGTFLFKFVVKDGVNKDTAYLQNAKIFAADISKDVFHGAPVEIILCDDFFNALTAVPMDESASKM